MNLKGIRIWVYIEIRKSSEEFYLMCKLFVYEIVNGVICWVMLIF